MYIATFKKEKKKKGKSIIMKLTFLEAGSYHRSQGLTLSFPHSPPPTHSPAWSVEVSGILSSESDHD